MTPLAQPLPLQRQGGEEPDGRSLLDVMLDMEIVLVRAHNWSLMEIDATDVTSLLMFMARYGEVVEGPSSRMYGHTPVPKGGKGGKKRKLHCDEVSWL